MVTSLQDLDSSKTYSYADYLTWQFTERVELLKGYVLQMAAPSPRHQRVLGAMGYYFYTFFRKQTCEVYYAPFDVRLYDRKKSVLEDKEVYTVVQPDICVICDTAKIDDKGCNGSPDLIIEILSPTNQKIDIKDKYSLYEANGVLEYWIVYPNDGVIHQFVLKDEKYYPFGVFTAQETIKPFLFPNLNIDLSEVFE